MGSTARLREGEAGAVKVEVEEVATTNGGRSWLANPDVLAVAPSMPTKLIAPMGGRLSQLPRVSRGACSVRVDRSVLTVEGILVAVLDTAIDGTHRPLRG